MAKKKKLVQIRVTLDQDYEAKEGYYLANYDGALASYYRDLILGKIKHPYHIIEEANHQSENKIKDTNDTGKVQGSEETRLHYDAIVTAAMMLKIKMDPEFQKYINAQPVMFQKLIDNIRGYKFDDETELKSPLKKNRKHS